MSTASTRHTASWWAFAFFAAGLIAGLVMIFGVFHRQGYVRDAFDPYSFGEMGKNLARGNGFAGYGTLLGRRAPLYPAMIGGIYALFGEHATIVLLLQCVLFGGTCALTFDMARRVFNLRTGIVAGTMCVVHPLMLRYVGDLHLETLLTFLFTLTVWCSVRFYLNPTVGRGAALGAAGAAAALTKAVVVLYPALFIVAFMALQFVRKNENATRRLTFAPVLAMVITMSVVILPWTARNYRASHGRFCTISVGFNDAFLRGYIFTKPDYALLKKSPYVDAENESNAWFNALARAAGTEWQRDDYETEQILGQESRRQLRTNPLGFVRKSVVGLFTFWYEMTSFANSLVVGLAAALSWILALIGARRAQREGLPVWLFLLAPLHLNVLLALLLALGRYSAPVVPALLVAAAFGADTLLKRREAPTAPTWSAAHTVPSS